MKFKEFRKTEVSESTQPVDSLPEKVKEKLEHWIYQEIGVRPQFTYTKKSNRHGDYISAESKDFTDKGAHGHLVEAYQLNASIAKHDHKDHGEHYSCDVTLNWQYKKRGSNGFDVGTVFINTNGLVIASR